MKSSLIRNQFIADSEEKQAISQHVQEQYIKPTEEEQKFSNTITKIISTKFSKELMENDIEDIRDDLVAAIAYECERLQVPFEMQKRIEKIVITTALGHGPIEEYLNDPDVTEIVVQRYDNIVIEKEGKIEKVEACFYDEAHLVRVIERIVQTVDRQINISKPIVDARLKDGSRVNATIPPVSPDGATLTIRKFNQSILRGRDYISKGSMTKEMYYFLERCVKGKLSIFVSGGTGSGKTTLLNMLSASIPANELIVTIEDTCELKLQQPNVRRMENRSAENSEMMHVDHQVLVRNALRMRPDRIILGETRDGSVVDLISAMSTGHEGSMSTVHANSPSNLCNVRIPILYSMNKDADFSEKSIAMQITEAVQIIVQISRMPDNSRKITHISHIDGIADDGHVQLRDIFIYDKSDKSFKHTGYIPYTLIKKIEERGFSFEETRAFKKGEN